MSATDNATVLREALLAGIEQAAIAREAGLSDSYLSRMASGERPVTDQIAAAARRLLAGPKGDPRMGQEQPDIREDGKTSLAAESITIDGERIPLRMGFLTPDDRDKRERFVRELEVANETLAVRLRARVAEDDKLKVIREAFDEVVEAGELALQQHDALQGELTQAVGTEGADLPGFVGAIRAAAGGIEERWLVVGRAYKLYQDRVAELVLDVRAEPLEASTALEEQREELRDQLLTAEPERATGLQVQIEEIGRRLYGHGVANYAARWLTTEQVGPQEITDKFLEFGQAAQERLPEAASETPAAKVAPAAETHGQSVTNLGGPMVLRGADGRTYPMDGKAAKGSAI